MAVGWKQLGDSRRLLLGVTGVVLSTGLMLAGSAVAEPDSNVPDSSSPGPQSGPSPTDEPDPGAVGQAVRILVQSSEFRSLDPRLRGAVVRDVVRDARRMIVEGEERGVTMSIPLRSPLSTNGPWVRVDVASIARAHGVDDPPRGHDALDEALAGQKIDPEDYSIRSHSATEEVAAIFVAIDVVGDRVLEIRPDHAPTPLGWTDAAGKKVGP